MHDVAEAHYRALVLPQAVGQRFLLSEAEYNFSTLAGWLRPVYGPRVRGNFVELWRIWLLTRGCRHTFHFRASLCLRYHSRRG